MVMGSSKRQEHDGTKSQRELPTEVWDKIIFNHLTMREFVCFRAVQKSWKAIAKTMTPQQIPWLILRPSTTVSWWHKYPSILHCLNLMDRKVYGFQFPSSAKRDDIIHGLKGDLFAANDGWVISRSWIFNPFTKEYVVLPRIKDDQVIDQSSSLHFPDVPGSYPTLRDEVKSKSMLEVKHSRETSELCFLTLFRGVNNSELWTQIINNSKSVTSPGNHDILDPFMNDALTFKGCVYALTSSRIWIFDLQWGTSKCLDLKFIYSKPRTVKRYNTRSRYPTRLVELDGNLLLVVMDCDPNTPLLLFKLEFDRVKWVMEGSETLSGEFNIILRGEFNIDFFKDNVVDIKGHTLFLGKFCSKSLFVTDSMSRSIRRNCVYGIAPDSPTRTWVYSLKDGTIEPLLSDCIANKFFAPYPLQWLMTSMC